MTTNPIHWPATVLKALLMGITIEIGGDKYVLQDDILCVIGHNITENGEIPLVVDYTLTHFCQICDRATSKEMALISANIVMNRKKKKK